VDIVAATLAAKRAVQRRSVTWASAARNGHEARRAEPVEGVFVIAADFTRSAKTAFPQWAAN
jgi:hypothetical protein